MNTMRRFILQVLSVTPFLGFGCPELLAAQKRSIPTTVDELYRAMCEAMPVGESIDIAWSATGEEYIEYGVATPNNAGAERRLCRWAWQTFVNNWRKSDTPRADILYWRIRPEVYPDENMMRIYMRYLTSSKPAIYTKDRLLRMKTTAQYKKVGFDEDGRVLFI